MRSTNWKDIAELIGIAAIVASLVAVVIELRQTQAAMVASTYQSRATDSISFNSFLAESEYLPPIFLKIGRDLDPQSIQALEDEELFRIFAWLMGRMVDYDNDLYQYQAGFLDEEFFENNTKAGIGRWAPAWRSLGIEESRSSFRQLVDEILAERDSI